jgi:lipid-A-disaccharide synthase
VGNPLVEGIQNYAYLSDWKKKLALPDNPLMAIFPGSRPGEISRHTRTQLYAAALLKAKHPNLIFALSCAHENLYQILKEQAENSPLKLNRDIFLVPREYSYELMKECKIALAKSGTVALELALHQKPSLIVYSLTTLNYLIAKYFLGLNLPHYCIVNILGQKEIFPELIQTRLDEMALFQHLDGLINNTEAYAKIEQECAALKEQLGTHSTSLQASQLIRGLC